MCQPCVKVEASLKMFLILKLPQVLLYQGQILLEGLFELAFHQLAHGRAFGKMGRMLEKLPQFCFELHQLLRGGDPVF